MLGRTNNNCWLVFASGRAATTTVQMQMQTHGSINQAAPSAHKFEFSLSVMSTQTRVPVCERPDLSGPSDTLKFLVSCGRVVFRQGWQMAQTRLFVCRCTHLLPAHSRKEKSQVKIAETQWALSPFLPFHIWATFITQHLRTTVQLSPLRSACLKRVRRERHPPPDVCNGYSLGPRVPPAPTDQHNRRFGEFSGSSGRAETSCIALRGALTLVSSPWAPGLPYYWAVQQAYTGRATNRHDTARRCTDESVSACHTGSHLTHNHKTPEVARARMRPPPQPRPRHCRAVLIN